VLPLVVIVGAPNVGKSTLFNRLVAGRRAIVTDEPGVTRDRLYGVVRARERPFRVVDTGGLLPHEDVPYAREIEQQADTALAEAHCILLVVDARAGATAVDRELAATLRRRDRPLILVANKIDSEKQEALPTELHDLGLGTPIAVSAEHDRGISELLDAIEALLPDVSDEVDPESDQLPIRVAIVGRPNVGKSSMLNRIVGEDRAVVSPLAGTTRDAVDTLLTLDNRLYQLIDTAGIRRRGRVQLRVERFSVARAQRNIERCDVAILVLDGSEEFAAQDAHIAGYVRDAFKPMLVAVNKWDLVEEREKAAKHWEDRLQTRLKFLKETPLLLVSAKSGQRVARILDEVDRLHAAASISVGTPQLNRFLRDGTGTIASGVGRDAVRVYYMTQTGVRPPTFALFCNDPRHVHFSYRRRLENALRRQFGFGAAPLRLDFRRRTRSPPGGPD
jgi:GTP-binding protein